MKVSIAALSALFLTTFSSVSLASFTSHINEVDPSHVIISGALELGMDLDGPAFQRYVERALRENAEVYQSLYLSLPPQFSNRNSYMPSCEELIFEDGNLREDSLITVLVAAMRHRNLALFQSSLSIAADNLGHVQGGECFERFIFELCSPLTPPTFLQAYLQTGGCDHGLAVSLGQRMNVLNAVHMAVYEQLCGKQIYEEKQELLALTDPKKGEFIEIVQLDGDKMVEPDSTIEKRTVGNFEIVFSVAGKNVEMDFEPDFTLEDVIEEFKNIGHPSIELAALVVDKKARKGALLKTSNIYGPFFTVLECTDDSCDMIPESRDLFVGESLKAPAGEILVSPFSLADNQLFIGLPKNYVKANACTLNVEVPFWFLEKPAVEVDVLRAFKMNLENKGNKLKTCVAYSYLNIEDLECENFSTPSPLAKKAVKEIKLTKSVKAEELESQPSYQQVDKKEEATEIFATEEDYHCRDVDDYYTRSRYYNEDPYLAYDGEFDDEELCDYGYEDGFDEMEDALEDSS